MASFERNFAIKRDISGFLKKCCARSIKHNKVWRFQFLTIIFWVSDKVSKWLEYIGILLEAWKLPIVEFDQREWKQFEVQVKITVVLTGSYIPSTLSSVKMASTEKWAKLRSHKFHINHIIHDIYLIIWTWITFEPIFQLIRFAQSSSNNSTSAQTRAHAHTYAIFHVISWFNFLQLSEKMSEKQECGCHHTMGQLYNSSIPNRTNTNASFECQSNAIVRKKRLTDRA